MASQNDFQAVQQEVTSSLVNITKLVAQLVAEDLPYQTTLNPSLGKSIDRQNARLLSLAKRLLDSAASGASSTAPELRDADDVDNNWRGVVDIVDSMLEKADICMDEYTGMIKRVGDSVQVEVSLAFSYQVFRLILRSHQKRRKRKPHGSWTRNTGLESTWSDHRSTSIQNRTIGPRLPSRLSSKQSLMPSLLWPRACNYSQMKKDLRS